MKSINQKDFFDVLHAPYVRGFSEGLRRKLRKFSNGFVPKKEETLYSKLCKLKHRNDPEKQKKNVVHTIECETWGVHYVGETGQQFFVRGGSNTREMSETKSSQVESITI